MVQAGDYEKDSIRLFGMFFTDTPVFFKTKEGIRLHIYDIATQYFLGTDKQRLIFGSFPSEMLQVVIKIMKDNKLDTIPIENMDLQYITLFRKLFWNHPEVEQQLNELKEKYNRKSYIELYNTFLTEMAKLKIYTDEQQTHLREFRIYLGKKSIDFDGELSSDLYGDLYNFLEFSRYESNDFIKEKVKETLVEIVQAIECGDCPDIRTFKSFADWDQLPNNILSKLEKLVLYNYCDKPDPKVVKEIRAAVEMMDIDKLKEYLGFNPVGRQRYALVFESRQNMAVNSRRCMEENSLVRLKNGEFKKAKDLKIGDKLLASDKKNDVRVIDMHRGQDILYKVTLDTGEELLLTEKHRLPTQKSFSIKGFSNNEEDYTMVKNLEVGDFVPTSLGTNFGGHKYTEAESELLGFLIGDGCLVSSGINITKIDNAMNNYIKKLVDQCGLGYNDRGDGLLGIHGAIPLVEKAGLRHSRSSNKHIPSGMFSECNLNKWALIAGLLKTDGCLQVHKGGRGCDGFNRVANARIEYCSISKELIEGMHIILNDLGVINYYNKKIKKIRLNKFKTDNYEAYYLYITDCESLIKVISNIDLSLKRNYDAFKKALWDQNNATKNSNIGLLPLDSFIIDRTKKGKIINRQYFFDGVRSARYNYQRGKAKNFGTEHWLDYQWSKIKSIEEYGEGNIIDIEVSGDHLYWIGDVLSHNSGKSFLAVYIVVRQLFLPGQMILYMLPIKEDYSEQPFFYIEQLLENVKKKGIELPGFQFNAKQFRVVNKVFKSKIIFLSAQGSSKGKSFSANLIVVDEAAMIADENLYDQAYNSTADTKGRIWAISTINVDTPVNRFFYNKIALEGIEDARIHNVDIYNNPFINAAEKADLERKYKDRNQNVWLADRMAIFVGGQDGFDVSKFFKIDFAYDVVIFKEQKFNLARNLDRYERFMVFYDPAKNKDKAGLVVVGKRRQAAEVVLTGYIDIKNYLLQWEVIIELIEYLSEIKPCEFGLDLGKAGEAALDWFESKKLAPYGILSTGGNESTRKTYRRRHVPAGMMESVLHALMAAGVVTGFSWLEFIRNEFDTYVLAKERRGNVGHHNDVLSALMNAIYIWYERGMIGFDSKPTEDKKNKKVPVDAYGRPIMAIQSGQFNGNRLSTFLH